MSNFIIRGLRHLDSKPVRKNGRWTYFDISLVLFSFFFVALSMYIYISNFREYPKYPEIENIKCDTATIIPTRGGNKFNFRDRKLYRLSNGEVLKASFSMKLPVEKEKASAAAKYYTSSAVSNEQVFYLCYILLEDVSLVEYHQVVYFSEYYDGYGLSEGYLSDLQTVFQGFRREIDELGWVAFIKFWSAFTGVFYSLLVIIFNNVFGLGLFKKKESLNDK